MRRCWPRHSVPVYFIINLRHTWACFYNEFDKWQIKQSSSHASFCCNLRSYLRFYSLFPESLLWRNDGHDGVSNHQPHDCLLNRLFRRRSKNIPNSASLSFVLGIHRWPVNSPHKWPVTRNMFTFDDVIMVALNLPSFLIGLLRNQNETFS